MQRWTGRGLGYLLGLSAVAWSGLAAAAPTADPAPLEAVSQHRGVFGGVAINYEAAVEETRIAGAGGAPGASIVSFSYLKSGQVEPGRPVLFVFNGGPGSASIWQHLGVFGPRRLAIPDGVMPTATPPFRLEDNPNAPLDVADVVLIDPPGTGFSHLLAGAKPSDFYGVQSDAQATVDFIEAWLTRHGRWNSPKFLVGESYGTIRAAVAAKLALGGPTTPAGRISGLSFNGVVLIGQAMDNTGDAERGYAEMLPSFAATAWYHKRAGVGRSLNETIAAAQAFASGDYRQALWAGDRLSPEARQAVAARLAALTGLPQGLILDHDLRISAPVFRNALLHDRDLSVGAYDSRYTLSSRGAGGDPVADDPAMGQYVPAFVAALHTYLHDELRLTIDRPYEAIAFHTVNGAWDYGDGPGRPSQVNYALDLAAAMRRNPRMKLMIGAGDYDLVTPLGSADYVAAHSDLPQDRVVIHSYEAGHMVYMGEQNAKALATDLRAFITLADQP